MENKVIDTVRAVKDILNQQTNDTNFSLKKFAIVFANLKHHPKLVFWSIIFTLATSVVTLPMPMIYKVIIDKYLPTKDLRMILIWVGVAFGIYTLNLVFNTTLNYLFATLNNNLMVSIKKSLFDKIISLPINFFTANNSGYITSRINEVDKLDSIFSITLSSFMVSLLTFVFSFIILACISWKILIITIIILPLQYLVVRRFTGGIRNISRQAMEKNAALNSDIQEVMAGINTIKSFSTEEKEQQRIRGAVITAAKTSVLQKIIYSLSNDIIGFVSYISGLVIFLACMYLIVKNEFSVGLYIACTQYVFQILMPIQSFASAGVILQPMAAAINRINEYFEMLGESSVKHRRHIPAKIPGKIEFKKVSFAYDDNLIFHGLSFKINAGDKVAVVGANGSGKTTLLKLILQLQLPHKGNIFMDNVDLGTYDLSNLRKKIGFVSQDVFLFNDTIKNNIIYGCNHYSEEELIEIINQYAPFINELPDGLNTPVGEKGGNLSGGQRQSISILRTILKHPDIFIFDEGSSHLDQASYQRLMGLINSYFHDKTCIFVTHDREILNLVNLVLRIENQRVIIAFIKEDYRQTLF